MYKFKVIWQINIFLRDSQFKMIFSVPVLIAIAIIILAIVLILEPENLSTGAVENKMMRN